MSAPSTTINYYGGPPDAFGDAPSTTINYYGGAFPWYWVDNPTAPQNNFSGFIGMPLLFSPGLTV